MHYVLCTSIVLQTCVNCQGSNPSLVVFLHILFGLVLVSVAVGLNIAAIPAVDTLLFLCQVSLTFVCVNFLLTVYCKSKPNPLIFARSVYSEV